MADNFGLKIGLEGEKEFKKAIADINQSFKVLGSEMKLVSSEFGKNDTSMQAVAARSEVLKKQIDAQKQKIEVLRQALKNASESFEENDRRTQSWQIQLNNAEAALNDMERELKANNDALSEASGGYTDAEKSVSKMADEMDDAAKNAGDMGGQIDDAGEKAEKSGGKFEKLGSVLKGIGTAMGAVAAAAGAAAVKLGKEVISAYADYEQLVGGVDTLFKDNSKELQSYAANAYKTAGLSANEYMETVTSFSASLIQSLGGDTEKAVKYADMAITDMSDNANKMGTDMSMIQSAYQGFAKQNYTMLDNLKLGYGGTKSEMERLLADAEAISGIHYNLESYTYIFAGTQIKLASWDGVGTHALVIDTKNHCVRPATIVDWDLGNISYTFGNVWCEKITIRNGNNDGYIGFNGGTFEIVANGAAVNRLGSSTYYWDTGYIEKLYLSSNCYLSTSAGKLCVNGTAIGGGSDPNMAGKEVKMGGSTGYYITANTSRELKPSSSSTSYPFYLGTASLYWHYAYLGSVQVKIGSGTSSKIGFFAGTPIARQTLSTYSQNMGYSSASSSNYLKILNNLVGILVKYGLIGT